MKKIFFLALVVLIGSCSGGADSANENISTDGADHIFATIRTNKGEIVVDLAYEQAPLTVANFVALAQGDFKTMYNEKGESFYSNTIFHRVVKDYIIQGGDPTSTGTGGPGYAIADEITDLKHDRPGTLAMANAGPNTNGSQFYITSRATPNLDGNYSVFGYVITGQDVVDGIEVGDGILEIKIDRVGPSAIAFDEIANLKRYSR